MKSNKTTTTLILIILTIISPIYFNNPRFKVKSSDITSNHNDIINHNNLKISIFSRTIHINNNWTVTKAAGICTGDGTYSNPYIIKNLVIDGDNSESCILIENSEVFFKIENCSVFNSYFGIRLTYTKNAWILNSDCSSNKISGISLSHSTNNNISGNIATNNDFYGINLFYSNMNNISKNIELDNSDYGISLYDSDNNLILNNIINSGIELDGIHNSLSNNLMYECGLQISSSNTMNYYYQNIDITNLINGKSLYYYTYEQNLGPNNFTNAGQIIMASCSNSLVTNLNLSYSDTGLTFINCHDNIVKRNSINNNRRDGIYIFGGDNNTISENSFSYNNFNGIFLELNSNNSFLENNVSYNNFNGFYCYGLENSLISGNDINHNQKYGINFINCKINAIIGNSLIGNEKCFNEVYSEGNVFENNECHDRTTYIPGYNLFLLLGILSTLVIILIKKKLKKSFQNK
ncbi:MAG: hypothetical protein EAX89_13925 [Candidatus Lokiarchaeota archaeon]|nr:hypothetical protein [Candidatus Lokiarchaeota archaeon]